MMEGPSTISAVPSIRILGWSELISSAHDTATLGSSIKYLTNLDFARGMMNIASPSQYSQTGTKYGEPSGLTVARRAIIGVDSKF